MFFFFFVDWKSGIGNPFFSDFFLISYNLRQWGTHGESRVLWRGGGWGGGGLEGANPKKKNWKKISKNQEKIGK